MNVKQLKPQQTYKIENHSSQRKIVSIFVFVLVTIALGVRLINDILHFQSIGLHGDLYKTYPPK